MLRSFDRLLREKGKHYSILTDRQFAKAREALSCKRKQLRRAGKGQKPNKALGLSETQIQKLWDEKQLGCHTPQAFYVQYGLTTPCSLGGELVTNITE